MDQFPKGTEDNFILLKFKNSYDRAPTDCVQYYTGFSGTFRSFNWQTTTPQLLHAQNYFMCFRQEEGNFEIFNSWMTNTVNRKNID